MANVIIDADVELKGVVLCKGRDIINNIKFKYGKPFSYLYIKVLEVTGTAIL